MTQRMSVNHFQEDPVLEARIKNCNRALHALRAPCAAHKSSPGPGEERSSRHCLTSGCRTSSKQHADKSYVAIARSCHQVCVSGLVPPMAATIWVCTSLQEQEDAIPVPAVACKWHGGNLKFLTAAGWRGTSVQEETQKGQRSLGRKACPMAEQPSPGARPFTPMPAAASAFTSSVRRSLVASINWRKGCVIEGVC